MNWKRIYGILAPVSVPVRIIAPFLIFQYPVFAVILVFFLDTIDGSFWLQSNIKKVMYQELDKTLDLWWYIVSLVYAYTHLPLFPILFGLFILRLIGHVIFYVNRKEETLIYFPNIYENLLIFVIFVTAFNLQQNLLSSPQIYYVFLFLTSLKIIQEITVHKYSDKLLSWLPEWARGPHKK